MIYGVQRAGYQVTGIDHVHCSLEVKVVCDKCGLEGTTKSVITQELAADTKALDSYSKYVNDTAIVEHKKQCKETIKEKLGDICD